jgi:hypothetical protein
MNEKIEFTWRNVGKKIINMFYPLMVKLLFKIQRKKNGVIRF